MYQDHSHFTNEKGKGYFPSEGKKKITDPKSQGQIQTQVAASIVSAKI